MGFENQDARRDASTTSGCELIYGVEARETDVPHRISSLTIRPKRL